MTAEQLQHARAAAWRQDGTPVLTADAAAAWLRETGLTPFLPRPSLIAAPAPSFAEATLGRSEPTPRPDAIESATTLLRRLLGSGDAVGLRLLGASGANAISDTPDFLATEDTLPFVFALRGDREWTRGPRGRSSPLVLEVWKLLERDGSLSAGEIKDRMGRHLTESAALRALVELWGELRIEPVFTPTEDTKWQLLERAHEKAMIAGSAIAHGMALSALVSVYLQTAVAATGDEIEAFLSPLASRSRVRDAVRGLHATRQLGLRNLGPREHFFVEGSLPEWSGAAPSGEAPFHTPLQAPTATALPDLLPEVPAPADVVFVADAESERGGAFRIEALSEDETERERTVGEGRKRYVAGRGAPAGDRKSYGARPGSRPLFSGGRPGPGGFRPGFGNGPRDGAARPDGERKPFFAREPWKEDRRPSASSRENAPGEGARRNNPAGEGSAPQRAFAPRGEGRPFSGGAKRPFTPRESGDRKPFGERKPFPSREGEGSDRKPFAPRDGGRDEQRFASREGGRLEGRDRNSFGGRPGSFSPSGGKPFRKPFEGGSRERRPFSPGAPNGGTQPPRRSFAPGFPGSGSDEDQQRRPLARRDEFAPRKPFAPKRDGGSDGDARPARGGFSPREGGEQHPLSHRPSGGGRPYGGESRSSGGGDRPFKPRSSSPRSDFRRSGGDVGDGPSRGPARGGTGGFAAGGRAPFPPRAGGAAKPFRRSEEGGDTPRRTGRPGSGRFAPEGRPAGASFGAPKSGSKRPRTAPFTSSGKPRSGVGATGRPGPRASRPGAGPRKPGFGPGKPGNKPGGGKGGRPRP